MQISPIAKSTGLFTRREKERKPYTVIPEEKSRLPIAYWNGRDSVSFVV